MGKQLKSRPIFVCLPTTSANKNVTQFDLERLFCVHDERKTYRETGEWPAVTLVDNISSRHDSGCVLQFPQQLSVVFR